MAKEMPDKYKHSLRVRILMTVPAVILSLVLAGLLLLCGMFWGDMHVTRDLIEENLKPGMSKAEILEILPPKAKILVLPSDDPYYPVFERVADVSPERFRESTGWILNYPDAASMFFRKEVYRLDFQNEWLISVVIETNFGIDEYNESFFAIEAWPEDGAEQ